MPATSHRHLPGVLPGFQRTSLGFLLLALTLPLAAQHQRAGGLARLRQPGSSRAAVALDTLTARPTLYAVGVAEGGGEIMVVAGQAHTTRLRPDGATETTAGFQGRAAWLLQSRVRQWRDAGSVPATITSPAQLAEFIHAAAIRAGLPSRPSQPFRLLGEPLAVWWHVAAYPTAGPADAAAPELGVHGRFAPGPLDLLGFMLLPAQRRAAKRLHLHGRPAAQPFVAHVDSLRPGPGLRLLLPALPH
ncbi:hypothetical protein FY528_15525 [Hymenobacter lutimineralis]|uniref:Uncharacterized protein n=1 Tax=Hymenobacter lutimineralis TaxID=2606448 RepID=A0A5D6UW69_9BACT|nr:hypothetical protein [Hymenobacter lutimineralis]TYZ07225.1 hypothetical protein FY528_15525 [Hymenobacter lutimineralis]